MNPIASTNCSGVALRFIRRCDGVPHLVHIVAAGMTIDSVSRHSFLATVDGRRLGPGDLHVRG